MPALSPSLAQNLGDGDGSVTVPVWQLGLEMQPEFAGRMVQRQEAVYLGMQEDPAKHVE